MIDGDDYNWAQQLNSFIQWKFWQRWQSIPGSFLPLALDKAYPLRVHWFGFLAWGTSPIFLFQAIGW